VGESEAGGDRRSSATSLGRFCCRIELPHIIELPAKALPCSCSEEQSSDIIYHAMLRQNCHPALRLRQTCNP
jgi:hypothetical protein